MSITPMQRHSAKLEMNYRSCLTATLKRAMRWGGALCDSHDQGGGCLRAVMSIVGSTGVPGQR